MKNMINLKAIQRIAGIIVLLTIIGFPLLAQPAPPTEEIQVIRPMENAVSNLIHRNIRSGARHFFRVNGLTDPFYYILWRDADDNRNLSEPVADIGVTILNLTTNRIIAFRVDSDTSMNEERLVNAIEIRRGVHYNSRDDIMIIIEPLLNIVGNYAIFVH